MPNAAQDPVVDDLRARITAADAEARHGRESPRIPVAELHAHKRAQGYEVFDSTREEQVIAAVIQANRGPISDAGLRELYRVILPLCTREAADS